MKNKLKILKYLLIIGVSIYVIITIINQQKILISYKNMENQIAKKIEEQEEYKNKLNISTQNIDSQEYIEKIAREKLGMYKTNERVYVNINN